MNLKSTLHPKGFPTFNIEKQSPKQEIRSSVSGSFPGSRQAPYNNILRSNTIENHYYDIQSRAQYYRDSIKTLKKKSKMEGQKGGTKLIKQDKEASF